MELYKLEDTFEQRAFVKYAESVLTNHIAKPKLKVNYVTADFLNMAGTPYALGRGFLASESLHSNTPVAVISYQTWQEVFAGRRDVLSEKITFDGTSFSIIGVTAADFVEPQLHETGRTTQVWLPWDFNPLVEGDDTAWNLFFTEIYLVAKLTPEQSADSVAHALTTIINQQFRDAVAGVPYFDKRVITVSLKSYKDAIMGDAQGRAMIMFAGILVLLLIAAVNITNLILARAANNQRKIVIQIALGAKRKHVFNMIFAEIVLLMLLACATALAVSVLANHLVAEVAYEQLPRVAELSLNLPTALLVLSCGLLLAMIFAAITTAQLNYRDLNKTLQSSGKGSGLQISPRILNLLIASQVALCCVLLTANVQVFSSAIKAIQAPLDFNTADLAFLDFDLGALVTKPVEERRSYIEGIKRKLSEHPAIEGVSLASNAPMARTIHIEWTTAVTSEMGGGISIGPGIATINENYLPIIGLPFVEGRNVTADEVTARDRVAVINETMAKQLSPNESAIGKPFYFNRHTEPYIVVGIVKDLTIPNQLNLPRLYVPMQRNATFMVKYKPGQQLDAVALNSLIAELHSEIYLYDVYQMDDIHQMKVGMDKLSAWITAALGLLSLVLAGIGIYGVLSYSMALRRFELGVRMAIGAKPRGIVTLVCKDTMKPVIWGLITGGLVLMALTYYLNQETALVVEPNLTAFAAPPSLVILLALSAAVASVWAIATRPVIKALRDCRSLLEPGTET